MRLLLYIILISVCNSIYGQEYNFDLMAKYSTSVNDAITESRTVYASTKDTSVVLMVGGFFSASEARIIDYKTKLTHHFQAKEKNNNGHITYEYKYKKTSRIKTPKHHRKFDFKFHEIKSDSLTKKVNLTIYSADSKKKLELSTRNLTLVKSEANFFPVYRLACLHPFESMHKLTLPDYYIVKSSVEITKYGNAIICELIDFKAVDFIIKIP